jgi:hypothetical protein
MGFQWLRRDTGMDATHHVRLLELDQIVAQRRGDSCFSVSGKPGELPDKGFI